MLRKYYDFIVERMSWGLVLAWLAAGACGLLAGAFSTPAIGVLCALALLAVLLVVSAAGGDRSDELLDILWVKDRTLGRNRAELEELQGR